MDSIIRVDGARFNGCTIAQMLEIVTSDPRYERFKNKPLLVIKNGKLITPPGYENDIIVEEDDILVMELTAGG